MTNERIKFFPTIDTLTDDAARPLIFTLARDCASYLLNRANHNIAQLDHEHPLTDLDYSGDSDDYNPAASALLDALMQGTSASSDGTTPLEIIHLLLDDDDLRLNLATIDFDSPILELIDFDAIYDAE